MAAVLRNVLVAALGASRFALELRWVKEVFTLVHLTPVPTAPPSVAGAVNRHGAIVPVLYAPALLPPSLVRRNAHAPRPGDAMILLDVEDMRAALAVDRVDAVASLAASERGEGLLIDADGQELTLVDAPALLRAAARRVQERP